MAKRYQPVWCTIKLQHRASAWYALYTMNMTCLLASASGASGHAASGAYQSCPNNESKRYLKF